MHNDRTPALLAALSVALKAKQGIVRPDDVADMSMRVQNLYPPDHFVRVAALNFAASWGPVRHDPAALADLGQVLHGAVIAGARPDPVDASRRDIHG